ncbi:MAG: AI-2E family transporter [Gemmatimonadota bacterium]|nr:AI-2E family transporter [Gemmatimonadota bacterium]
MTNAGDEVSDRDQLAVWRGIEAAAVILVLGFFLYATRDVLNPLLLFILLWAVLLPFRGKEGYTALLTVAGLATLLWLLSSTGSLLAPFLLAMVLAYTLDPLVDKLERRGVSRSLAIGLLTVAAIVVLGVVFLLVLPAALRELGQVVQEAPLFFQRLGAWLESVRERILSVNIPLIDEDDLLLRLQNIDSDSVVAFLQERREALGAWMWGGVLGLGRGIGSVFTVLGYVALTPVLTFYLLRDWDGLTAGIADLVPGHQRESFVSFAGECNRLVSRYLRGQVTVAIALGLITGAGLWITSFPYAGTLALIVAIFSVVPYLGLVLSLIPAIFIALVSGSVGVSLLKVAGVYGISQLLEGTVISPRIVGDSVGLHPVWVVLALALGGFYFGFVGLLIGVPAAAVTKLMLARGLERYRASDFYRGREPAGA